MCWLQHLGIGTTYFRSKRNRILPSVHTGITYLLGDGSNMRINSTHSQDETKWIDSFLYLNIERGMNCFILIPSNMFSDYNEPIMLLFNSVLRLNNPILNQVW